MNNKALRKELIGLLKGGQAHSTLEEVLKELTPELCNKHPQKGIRSVYEELEHMRLAQEDILRYTLDPSWESPEWPDEFWPSDSDEMTEEILESAVSGFFSDLDELIALVKNPEFDLMSQIPHGEGHTYLREILLVADHNAYHLGKIVRTLTQLGE
ncbi:MAG: DinB family protein [Candidatus Scalindua sp.]|nr:DinB family protein [Candidatus Scalindua sp.]